MMAREDPLLHTLPFITDSDDALSKSGEKVAFREIYDKRKIVDALRTRLIQKPLKTDEYYEL